MATKTITKTAAKSKTGTKTLPKDVGPTLTQRIKSILEDVNEKSWYEIPLLLSEAYHKQDDEGLTIWAKEGFTKFEEYAQSNFNMEYRTAQNKVQVGDAIQRFNITKKMILDSGIEWTKFREISYLFHEGMTQKQLDALLKKASKMNFQAVRDFVKTQRVVKAGGTPSVKVAMNFKFLDEQAKVIEEAMAEAGRLYATENPNLQIESICTDWLMNHSTDQADVTAVKEQLHTETEPEVTVPRKEKSDKGKKKGAKATEKAKKGKKKAKKGEDTPNDESEADNSGDLELE